MLWHIKKIMESANTRWVYPVIMAEFNDEDGHYFVVTSPNIPGMVTEGKTEAEAAYWAEDAIATMIEDTDYPEPQDTTEWQVKDNERIVYISVDMTAWLRTKKRTVQKTITVPEYLSDMAKKRGLNVSAVATRALAQELNVNI